LKTSDINSVTPEGAESACGGESRKQTRFFWIPDLDFASSGMTIIDLLGPFKHKVEWVLPTLFFALLFISFPTDN
jgi:hypothetical protein